MIDPTRDIEQYLALAASLNLRITHVTETHIHADFVSGSRELAARSKATLHLSDEGGDDWRYRLRRRRRRGPAARGRCVRRRPGAGPGDAYAGAHAGARHLPRHRRRGGHRAHRGGDRRLRLRGRRGPPRPAGARGAGRGLDGIGGAHALPEHPALQVAARLSPDLARARRGLGVRQGDERDSPQHRGLRAAVQLGVRRDRRVGVRAPGAGRTARSAEVLRHHEAHQQGGAAPARRPAEARADRAREHRPPCWIAASW